MPKRKSNSPRRRNCDPIMAHDRAVKARAAQRTPGYHVRRVLAYMPSEAVEDWAEQLAASLPPLTPDEAAAVGALAAALDARRQDGGDHDASAA